MAWLKWIFLGYMVVNQLSNAARNILNNIEYEWLPIRKGDIKIFREKAYVRLLVRNKNDFDIPINRVTATLTQGDSSFAAINSNKRIILKANAEKEFMFEVKITSEQLFYRIADILEGGNLNDPIKINGRFQGTIKYQDKSKDFSVPFTHSFKIM